MREEQTARPLPRRQVLRTLGAVGIGSAFLGHTIAAAANEKLKTTTKMIERAEWVTGLEFTGADRELMLKDINDTVADFEKLRALVLDNSVPPALRFEAIPSIGPQAAQPTGTVEMIAVDEKPRPSADIDLAYAQVTELAMLLRSKKISSVELTRFYLDRLHKYNELLKCVITFTDELALKQAETADREIAAGRWRGPLHGIPWGAKDLLAVSGYRTTWGSVPYKEQILQETATVATRLEQAGAVLVAKTSVGELAWGDVWFDGMTRNPWKPEEGSSGSSAGSASAVAAGLVGFAIGTETLGSIVSPSTICGTTGLRPTFGRVSRHGAMSLCFSMDKIGPIGRAVEDCALVFGAIHGSDAHDPTAVDRPFDWPGKRDPKSLKIGFVESAFEMDRTRFAEKEEEKRAAKEWQEYDKRTLQQLRDMGFQLTPIKLPEKYPVSSLGFILGAEAASMFDELTRTGKDDTMVRQTADAWPNVFRQGQLIPAVEYIRANRIRTLVMREMSDLMSTVDLYVSPSWVGGNLLLTNLTGHPCVVLPNGFRTSDGTPTSITFIGGLFGETDLLAMARLYQQQTGYHLYRPKLAS